MIVTGISYMVMKIHNKNTMFDIETTKCEGITP